jgi:hypothetical protein
MDNRSGVLASRFFLFTSFFFSDMLRLFIARGLRKERKKLEKLEVKTGKFHYILIVLLGLFLVPLSLFNLINGISGGFKIVPFGIGLMMLLIFGLVVWLMLRAYRKSVKYFTGEGLKRNDGRELAWTDLSRVVNQIRIKPGTNIKMLWRTEIHFKNGEKVWLIPGKVSNFGEVSAFVGNLPCEHTEVNV